MKSAKRFPFVPFPRRPRDTKARNALRKALACNVWAIKDPDAYAREFERKALACNVWAIKDPDAYAREFDKDMGFGENDMNTAEQQQAQVPADHGNNQRSERQEHAR